MTVENQFKTLPSLQEIVSTYNLKTKKALGQHFLFDNNLTDKIARCAGNLTKGTTFEIGPGPGGLTRSLLKAGAHKVIAIERDPRCVAALSSLVNAADGKLKVIEGNAQLINLSKLAPPPRRIVANLPYNISTLLLTKWISDVETFTSMTLMFQKEVAKRIVATPGTKIYGRLSVICNWQTETDFLFSIPSQAFVPTPKVSSALVSFRPVINLHNTPNHFELEEVTAAAFGQRRKMLRSSLKPLGCDPLKLLALAEIKSTKRAEELAVKDFVRLAKELNRLRKASLQNR